MSDRTETIDDLDKEIKTRFGKRTGSLGSFLSEWIRLDESQDKLFQIVGANGETYFQYKLAQFDMDMSLGLAHMCRAFAESTDPERAIDFLNKHDSQGNDVWHYLADVLKQDENKEGLMIAKILLELELSYTNRNAEDETALGRLLIPECKWTSINAIMQVTAITLGELEEAFDYGNKIGKKVLHSILADVLTSDLDRNEGKLTDLLIKQALHPVESDMELRKKTCAVLFDYRSGKKLDTVFMRVVSQKGTHLLERTIALLTRVSEDSVREIAAKDIQLSVAEQQKLLYTRLSRQNRSNQNALFKAVIADRQQNISHILSVLLNENIVLSKKNDVGHTVNESYVVDEKSAARQNPRLALLLHQDSKGNTVFHLSVLLSHVACLRTLFVGLSMMDSYMISAKIPNRFGLTCGDFLEAKRTRTKLTSGLKAGNITKENAQNIFALVSKVQKEVSEFLGEQIRRSEDTITRTGGMSEAKPTFDIRRIPTVSLLRLERNTAATQPAAE